MGRPGTDLGGPGSLDFTEHEASQLLTVFATHWEHLPPTEQTDEIRYHLVVLDAPIRSAHVAVAFVARQLRSDQILVIGRRVVLPAGLVPVGSPLHCAGTRVPSQLRRLPAI